MAAPAAANMAWQQQIDELIFFPCFRKARTACDAEDISDFKEDILTDAQITYMYKLCIDTLH